MDRQEIIATLKNIIADYLKTKGLELVDLIYRYEGRDLVLRILADRPEGGITLDECALLNTEISRILDEQSIIQQSYLLEVSSPGVDRPLTTRGDFLRCLNRRARLFLLESIKGKWEIDGLVSKVDENSVYLDSEGEVFQVPLAKIRKAKQIIGGV